ncbi:MAG TPA: protein kinase [Bryobacteraceae bacterium]|nr:protein kinase [Bryobacteraceae bacterium]
MPLSAGDQLGPYEILTPLGAGGMGEVWKARDTRLGREVAIKTSKEQFGERFEREARAVAALNHPNICAIYDVGPNYLVMELVEGPTLAERLKGGAIPLDDALAIARQIGSALDAAHEKGITHRDLKPANIKVKADGTVKVLDFGLAKIASAPASAGENSPTLTIGMTEVGMILGTAAYMSPEQARGKNVDKRADIWAFGVVLYEMLTGRRLFQGDDVTDTLAAVLRHEPDWTPAPPQVRRLLKRCLQRDPAKRLRDIGDVWELLEEGPAPEEAVPLGTQRRKWLWPSIAALMTLAAAGIAGYFLTRPARTPLATQFTLLAPPETVFTNSFAATAISPDGRFLVFGAASGSAAAMLWLRPLDSQVARPLPGTDGANFPFWSPNSKSVAFFAGGKLKRVEIAGGAPLVVCDASLAGFGSVGGAWSRDGVILFGEPDGLHRVSASGGVPALLTRSDAARQEGGHGYPQFLPDGKHFLYFVESANPNTQGMYANSVDRPQDRALVVRTAAKALYAPPVDGSPGALLWIREQTLLAQRFDAANLRLEGDPTPIAEDLSLNGPRAAFWTSDAGVLAYRTGIAQKTKLVWIARDGKRLGEAAPEDVYSSLRLSPDGKRLAIGRRPSLSTANADVWLLEFARNTWTRFTFDPMTDLAPAWAADGRQIAFNSNRSGSFQLYRKDSGGAGQDEQLTGDPGDKGLTDWSRDGRYLLFEEVGGKTSRDLWALPLEGERKSVPVVQTPFDDLAGRFSPDGKWVAYVSSESGRLEVYVQAFPGAPSAPRGKWQVSSQGGVAPVWRGDGRELFFLSPDVKMMAAGIRPATTGVEMDTPRELFATAATRFTNSPYDVTADGQRFLVEEISGAPNAVPLTVVVHWQAGLK